MENEKFGPEGVSEGEWRGSEECHSFKGISFKVQNTQKNRRKALLVPTVVRRKKLLSTFLETDKHIYFVRLWTSFGNSLKVWRWFWRHISHNINLLHNQTSSLKKKKKGKKKRVFLFVRKGSQQFYRSGISLDLQWSQ